MTDDAARQAERQRSFFMECLALATHQYGMSASPADTVAAAVTYFNALNGIAAQCPPDHGDVSKGNGPGLYDAITGVRL